jgi:hypothetical protein
MTVLKGTLSHLAVQGRFLAEASLYSEAYSHSLNNLSRHFGEYHRSAPGCRSGALWKVVFLLPGDQ